MGTTRPVCAYCEREIVACASCCRHTGWKHRGGEHLCDPKDPTGHMAFPRSIALNKPQVVRPGGFR